MRVNIRLYIVLGLSELMSCKYNPVLQLEEKEKTLKISLFFFCGTRASYGCGLSRCGAQAPDAQAQRPRLTGPAAARHVGSSRTGARTHVPCIGRQTPNHCATREAQSGSFTSMRQNSELWK